MEYLNQFALLVSLFLYVVEAFPQQTAAVTTTAASAMITKGPELICAAGQTAIYTTDCTMGTPVSYCFRPEPPIKCLPGFFPSVWHPEHCMEQSTCFPVTVPWITTECSNGATAYSTSTIYDGTLANGVSTIIKGVSCACAQDQWYSMALLPGSSSYETFCMPHSSCPDGMSTSVSVNEYCATQPSDCRGTSLVTHFCECAHAAQTPVYPERPGAEATGCAFIQGH